MIDAKATKWHELWYDSEFSIDEICTAFANMREWARIQGLAPIDGDDVRSAAARTKARAGLGVDQLTPLDIQRLPPEGHEALAGILNLVEDTGTWPTQ
eukprot:6903245-Pyramimonas_sp.AAC.1